MPITGAYWVGGVTNRFGGGVPNQFGGPCPTGQGPAVTALTGPMIFSANGNFTWSHNLNQVCAGGSTSRTQSGNGVYEVWQNGALALDYAPLQPGSNTREMHIRPDGSLMLSTTHELRPDAATYLAVRESSGHSVSSLSGSYHVVRLTQTVAGAGISAQNQLGTITFNGQGGWSESGVEMIISSTACTQRRPYAGSGNYAIANNGVLSLNGSANGALSPTGDLVFWVTSAGTSVSLTVCLRQGSGHSAADMDGRWGLVGHEYDPFSVPKARTQLGYMTARQLTPLTGDLDINLFEAFASQFGPGASWNNGNRGTYMIDTLGHLSFTMFSNYPPYVEEGAVSADSTMFVLTFFDCGQSGLSVGLRPGGWPIVYGNGVPGSAGLQPRIDGSGGFPNVGNANFAVRMDNASPGASLLFVLGGGTGPGIPLFCGNLWVSPVVFSIPGVASPSGSAPLPLPIPAGPALGGVALYAQGLVIDPGACQGIAMTSGLMIEIGL